MSSRSLLRLEQAERMCPQGVRPRPQAPKGHHAGQSPGEAGAGAAQPSPAPALARGQLCSGSPGLLSCPPRSRDSGKAHHLGGFQELTVRCGHTVGTLRWARCRGRAPLSFLRWAPCRGQVPLSFPHGPSRPPVCFVSLGCSGSASEVRAARAQGETESPPVFSGSSGPWGTPRSCSWAPLSGAEFILRLRG